MIEANEKIVLGTAMGSPSLAKALLENLGEVAFGQDGRKIFDLIKRVISEDPSASRQRYVFQAGDIAAQVIDVQQVFDPMQFDSACNSIANKYRNRESVKELEDALRKAKGNPEEAFQVAKDVGLKIDEAADRVKAHDILENKEIAQRAIVRAREMKKEGRQFAGIPCKWKQWADLQNSFIPGLYGFQARSKNGKTTVTLDLARQFMELGHRVGIITLEMSAEQLSRKMAQSVVGCNDFDMMLGKLTDQQFIKWEEWSRMEANNFVLASGDGIKSGDLPEIIRRMVKGRGVSVVFIDYLQLIRSSNKGRSRAEELTDISYMLHSLATYTFSIPIIALVQSGRQVDDRADKMPTAGDPQHASGIEQAVVALVSMYRPAFYNETSDKNGIAYPKGLIKMRIVARRFGYSDRDLNFVYDEETSRLVEIDEADMPPVSEWAAENSEPF